MSFLSVLKDFGFVVLGAYLGGGASILVSKLIKSSYNFFSFVNEYVFRIKPKGEAS